MSDRLFIRVVAGRPAEVRDAEDQWRFDRHARFDSSDSWPELEYLLIHGVEEHEPFNGLVARGERHYAGLV